MFIRVSILALFVLMRLTTFCHGYLMKISEKNRSSERETSSENMPAKLHESSTDIQISKLSTTSQFPGQFFLDTTLRNISVPSPRPTPEICKLCSFAQLFYKNTCTERTVKTFPNKTLNRPIQPSSEEISYPDDVSYE
ncbi:uncharacterized protein LOC134269526 [Saccostrea cucullata]|uniref:uncharacterized protein LOC134269526 n=1 Tax=Saccostrea cuccullata TaxID=36930 RepID=UPI002ED41CA1